MTDTIAQDILNTVTRIRSLTPYVPVDPQVAKGSEVWEGYFKGLPLERVIIYLRSSGCFWSAPVRRRTGEILGYRSGCLDCEHSLAGTTFGESISAKSYVEQFNGEFSKYDWHQYPMLCLYNEGNLLNAHELPEEALTHMLRTIDATPSIKSLVIESSTEFINDETLGKVASQLPNTHVDVGIGLESANPVIRELCVNKSHTLNDLEEAAATVNRHVSLLTYILLKPNFLTEREAIEDSIASVTYAQSLGVRYIAIEPLSLGNYNLSGVMFNAGIYRPVWLWSIIEVVKASHATGCDVIVGGYQFAPRYERLAQNCDLCTMRVKDAIRMYNHTNDLSVLVKQDCQCKKEWQRELDRNYPPLQDRIPDALVTINSYIDSMFDELTYNA